MKDWCPDAERHCVGNLMDIHQGDIVSLVTG